MLYGRPHSRTRLTAPEGPRDHRRSASEMVQTTVVTGVCSGGWCCEKATLYTKTKRSVAKKEKSEAGGERHSSNTLSLSRTVIAHREYTVQTVQIQKTRDLTAGPMLCNDLLYMVRAVRLELTRLYSLRILSPLRLPIPPCSPSRMNAS